MLGMKLSLAIIMVAASVILAMMLAEASSIEGHYLSSTGGNSLTGTGGAFHSVQDTNTNWTAVEEYGELLSQGLAMIKKEANWELINTSDSRVTADGGYYIAQFTDGEEIVVVIINLHSKKQINMSWEQFQDAKEYGKG